VKPKKKTKAGRRPTISNVFDESELQLIGTANAREKNWRTQFDKIRRATAVRYSAAGNFTKCVIVTPRALFMGLAKRNPTDKANPAVGKNIAFYRALVEPEVTV
jgi:hypothetical protein